ncbi:metal ABC transporter permease [Erwinia sp. 198]|uniref:metal ABC transporter permease n=1 Tax=Erwinia sp. 198 TaxID=2022746 RepID=UPI000F66AB8A|nr:metal ABC transporter permease [Erwinia sp. 198]RRZ86778.1 metal ABC transporter permease [Erwinia sp. 198]
MSFEVILESLLQPLRYDFMLKAMATGVFVCSVCAVLSCFIVLKGWALIGDAISHAILPGVIFAYIIGVPMALGAIVSGVACVMIAGAVRNLTTVKPDALLGISFTGFLGVGIILLVATPGNVHFMHILFGNLLGIETSVLIQTVIIGTLTLLTVLIMRKDLILFCFDPCQASVIGRSPARLELILLVMVAATAVTALQVTGSVLVVAMLIAPGCIGFLLTRRIYPMLLVSVLSAVIATVVGTFVSFWLNGETGATIVLVQAALFLLAFLFAPRNGLLRRNNHCPRVDDKGSRKPD